MMRTLTLIVGLSALVAGCNGEAKEECTAADKFDVFTDLDGDGFGTESAGSVCVLGADQAEADGDCDDDDPKVNPEAEERCNGLDDDCDAALDDGLEGRVFFLDADGDGFGSEADAVTACAAPPGRVLDDTDCDDTASDVFPDAIEICSEGVDEDCDGLADDDDDSVDPASMSTFYLDSDEDGFGDPARSGTGCSGGDRAVANADDCDDREAAINPDAAEVCNQRDDDCDSLRDQEDDSIDPTTLLPGFTDADGDGHGDPTAPDDTCRYVAGFIVEFGDDCDDTSPTTSPSDRERFCDSVDNDCDAATIDNPDRDGDGLATCDGDCDDTDPDIIPGASEIPGDGVDQDCDGEEDCFRDQDGDLLRNDVASPGGADFACSAAPNAPPAAPIDCDDTDAAIDWDGDWVADGDGDGFGAGAVVVEDDCDDQGAGFAPFTRVEDCDDLDELQAPGLPDICGDGVDSDCDGSDQCRTCADHLESDPAATTGTYRLRGVPQAGDFYCDMDTDGGGWTLVAANVGYGFPLDNYGVMINANSLADLDTGFTGAIWNGLRDVLPEHNDVRFTCGLAVGDPPAVDLTFYDTDWYHRMTEPFGSSCFDDLETPRRRDNLTGVELPASDAYAAGAIIGEDSCSAYDDFTVDFDDAGMNGNESDGTDWGKDDNIAKCGAAGAGVSWWVYVR